MKAASEVSFLIAGGCLGFYRTIRVESSLNRRIHQEWEIRGQ